MGKEINKNPKKLRKAGAHRIILKHEAVLSDVSYFKRQSCMVGVDIPNILLVLFTTSYDGKWLECLNAYMQPLKIGDLYLLA